MKKLQLLFVCLLMGNVAWASTEKVDHYSFVKETCKKQIEAFLPSEEASYEKNDGCLYSKQAQNNFQGMIDFLNSDYRRSEAIGIVRNESWEEIVDYVQVEGMQFLIQRSFFKQLIAVANEEQRDLLIDTTARNVQECMESIEAGNPALPECLKPLVNYMYQAREVKK